MGICDVVSCFHTLLQGYPETLAPTTYKHHYHCVISGLSCYAQPFGYNGIAWAWDLLEIASQINMTHRLADHWDLTHPGR